MYLIPMLRPGCSARVAQSLLLNVWDNSLPGISETANEADNLVSAAAQSHSAARRVLGG